MKKSLFAVPLFLLAGIALVGCSNTAEGVAEDTQNHVNAASNAAENAGEAAAQATQNAANAVDNAGEAVAQGAQNAANAVGNAAENAGEAAAKAGQNALNAAGNAGEAVANAAESAPVTGKVKLAITADSKLNDPKNTINVDTKDGQVILRGNVASEELKKHAAEVAMKVIKDNNYSEKVTNQLTVGAK